MARAPSVLVALFVVASGCEVVTGFDDLEFVPEPCGPEDAAEACAGVACGSRVDRCGNEVSCDDTCQAPYACAVGGVDVNACGCTGGSLQTPLAPPECALAETFEGRSYYFCEPRTWEEGRAFCRSFGTDLVVIDRAAENAYVTGRMPGKSWLGLAADPSSCDEPAGCVFSWVDETVLDATRYQNWNLGEPNGGVLELCVELKDDPGEEGTWNDLNCGTLLFIVCETTCPDG